MRRSILVILLLIAAAGVACSSPNKHNSAITATPVAGNLVPAVTSPVAGTTASPRAASSARTSTPSSAFAAARPGSPTPGAAATATGTPATAAAGTAAATAAPQPQGASSASAATGTPAPAEAASSTPAAATPSGATDARTLIDQIKLTQDDLPAGFSLGQLSAYLPNQAAITGFADPSSVLDLLNSSGRQDGYVQQVSGSSGDFAASIQVWGTADGAKQFMDQHPLPDSSVTFEQVDLAQPLGDQSFALKITSNGQTSYALSWRRGRLVLGMGGPAGSDGAPSQDLLKLAGILDQKAQAAQQ